MPLKAPWFPTTSRWTRLKRQCLKARFGQIFESECWTFLSAICFLSLQMITSPEIRVSTSVNGAPLAARLGQFMDWLHGAVKWDESVPHSMGRHHLQYCAVAMETGHVWMWCCYFYLYGCYYVLLGCWFAREYWRSRLRVSLSLDCFVIFACKGPKSCRWSPVAERAQSGNWQLPLLLGQSTLMWWASTQRFLGAKFIGLGNFHRN